MSDTEQETNNKVQTKSHHENLETEAAVDINNVNNNASDQSNEDQTQNNAGMLSCIKVREYILGAVFS